MSIKLLHEAIQRVKRLYLMYLNKQINKSNKLYPKKKKNKEESVFILEAFLFCNV